MSEQAATAAQQAGLFGDTSAPPPDAQRTARTVNSALWAAYGDALGFITELADAGTLSHRLGDGDPLTETRQWRRRIGGRQGVSAILPKGCYSDDTQLRLSTSRAIGPEGFDIEAFSKVELTVWPSYSLGGGRGTKTAAANLSREAVTWFANTFRGWTTAGGNGAAMRIQPHIWAAPDLTDLGGVLTDVASNAICTHGSPTGILGAVIHAIVLAQTLRSGEVPSPGQTVESLSVATEVPELMAGRDDIRNYWLPLWEQETRTSFSEAWSRELEAVTVALEIGQAAETDYERALRDLDLFNPRVRGSGTLTAVAAIVLARLPVPHDEKLLLAIRFLGSDTDTLATMAGALLGAASPSVAPSGVILDKDLIEREAVRMANLARGVAAPGFRYPDLLRWSPPRTQADALTSDGDDLIVTGLGRVDTIDKPLGPSGEFLWEWVRTSFGQTLLIKRRVQLPVAPRTGHHESPVPAMRPRVGRLIDRARPEKQPHETLTAEQRQPHPLDRGVALEAVLRYVEERQVDDQAIGYAVRRVARDGTREQLISFVAELRDRLRRND